jgi:hypothetical protein
MLKPIPATVLSSRALPATTALTCALFSAEPALESPVLSAEEFSELLDCDELRELSLLALLALEESTEFAEESFEAPEEFSEPALEFALEAPESVAQPVAARSPARQTPSARTEREDEDRAGIARSTRPHSERARLAPDPSNRADPAVRTGAQRPPR